MLAPPPIACLGAGHIAVTDFVAARSRRADHVHVLDRAHVVVGVGGSRRERDTCAEGRRRDRDRGDTDEPLVRADELAHREAPPKRSTQVDANAVKRDPALQCVRPPALVANLRRRTGTVSRSDYAFSGSTRRHVGSDPGSSAFACATESSDSSACGGHAEPFGERGAAQTLRLEVERELVRGRELAPISPGRHRTQRTDEAVDVSRSRYAFVGRRYADCTSPSAGPRSARLLTPSLVVARRRCPSTVLTPTPSRSAMALFDSPPAASRLTSSSRRVRAGTASRSPSAGVRAPSASGEHRVAAPAARSERS